MNPAFAWIKPDKIPAQAEFEKPDPLWIGLFLCPQPLFGRLSNQRLGPNIVNLV
jgi:hypothetical protein